MEFQRFFLFIALALVIMLLTQSWFEYTASVNDQGRAQVAEGQVAGTVSGEVPDAPEPAAVDNVSTADASVPQTQLLEGGRRIRVETDLLFVEIDTLGGDIRRVALKKYPTSVETPDDPFVLMNDGGADVFILQGGLIGNIEGLPNHKTEYRAEAQSYSLADGADSLTVPLHYRASNGVEYTKAITFHRDSYHIDIAYEVDNQGAEPWNGFLYSQFQRTQVADEGSFGFFGRLPSYKGGAIYTPENKFEKIDFSEMFDANLDRDVDDGWVAMLQLHFVGALLPGTGGQYNLYSRVLDRDTAPRYNIGYKTRTPVTIAPGSSDRLVTSAFVGPKEQDRLDAQGIEGLKLTVDYGWLTPVASPLFWVLDKIHGIIGNWGWAIILLTLLVKLMFYPLSAASYKSMARMKKMQPRLQTLKERYGDDRQKLNQAMMELYKKEKINPLGGCLPILIQIPVFIALYWVLLESVELRQAPFMLWLNDLSLKDPYYVLPILMGGSMLAQHFLNPAPLDPVQKNIMMAMPIVFTFFFLWFPAGLVLYWLVNNILSIAQQWYITRKIVS